MQAGAGLRGRQAGEVREGALGALELGTKLQEVFTKALCLCRYFPTLCRLADTRKAGVCCRTEEVTTTSTTAAPVLAARCGEVSFSVDTEDRDKVQFPGAKALYTVD